MKNDIIQMNSICRLHILSPFTKQSRVLTAPEKKPFENITETGGNAGNQ